MDLRLCCEKGIPTNRFRTMPPLATAAPVDTPSGIVAGTVTSKDM